jgi:hypothetical protein
MAFLSTIFNAPIRLYIWDGQTYLSGAAMESDTRYSVRTPLMGDIIRKLGLPLDMPGLQQEAVMRGLGEDESKVYTFGQLVFWIAREAGLVADPAPGTTNIVVLSDDLLH